MKLTKKDIREYLTILHKQGLDLKTIKERGYFLREMYKAGIILEEQNILDYLAHFKATTQKQYLSIINDFLRFMELPVIKVKIKTSRPLPKTLSNKRVQDLIQYIMSDSLTFREARNKLLLYLLLIGGLRITEALRIKFGDIKDTLIYIKGKGHKGEHSRTIDLTPKLKDMIVHYCRFYPGDIASEKFIIVGPTGKPLTRQQGWNIVKKYVGTHPHALRHTFATLLLEQEKDIRTVQEALGHKTITSTQIYAEITNTKRRKAIERLEHNLIGGEQL